MWTSRLTLKMPSLLLWIIWEIMFTCVWSLWRSGYGIRLSICSQAEAVEPNCGAKPTKHTQRTRQQIGRASCRERVEISGVEGAVKKKKDKREEKKKRSEAC